MSLFSKMTGSYGIVPGNGHHKSDDLIMNAGKGHVVPGENVHVAQRILSDMGYDPEQRVDLNQGKGNGSNIRISSKEMFLNEDQVREMEARGINPETLSPNSDYNKTGNNMNGGPKSYQNGGSLYELMMNNNNQYPAYQNAGPTDPPPSNDPTAYVRPDLSKYPYHVRNEEGAKWYDDRGNMVYFEGPQGEVLDYTTLTQDDWNSSEGYTPEFDVNNPPAGSQQRIQMQPLGQEGLAGRPAPQQVASQQPTEFPVEGQDQNMMYAPGQEPWRYTGTNPEGTLVVSAPEESNEIGSLPIRKAQPIENNVQRPGEGALPSWIPAAMSLQEPKPGINPEEAHLNELLEKNKNLANKEVAANLAMLGWNMSRELQPMEQPKMVQMREMVRDYEGMKGKATADLERGERRNAYMLKQLGAPEKIVGLHANTVQGTNQISQSLWEMQQGDSMANINAANQARMDYENAMRQHRQNEAMVTQAFKDKKGASMAENVAQIFDVRDNELNNESTLKGYKVNEQMDELDRQYNNLDPKAIGTSRYFSRQDWYKMSPEERQKWIKISEDSKKK